LSAIANRSITRIGLGGSVNVDDRLAVEEPIEIAVAWTHRDRRIRRSVSVTMRTPSTSPSSDHDLACGFLFTEGILKSMDQVDVIEPSTQDQAITVVFRPGIKIDLCHLKRHFYTTSSCGVCGKTSIDAVTVHLSRPLEPIRTPISSQTIFALPDRLREHQSVFAQTGGLHGCGLFDFDGRLIAHAEDVGRHNAVDKLIGKTLQAHATDEAFAMFSRSMLVLSGRVSFELVQKSLVAGIPMLVAVGAPSSLAVELAQRNGQTLIGFAGTERYNVYCD
jgi:FdhD protein